MLNLFVILASLQFFLVLGDKPIPTFPLKFIARTYRNTTEIGSPRLTTNEISLDATDLRASIKITTLGPLPDFRDGLYFLIFRPEGADRGSPASLGYVYFSIQNETSGDSSEMYCSYTTDVPLSSVPFYPPLNFPSQWSQNGDIEISGWFWFPSSMDYKGTSQVDGQTVDIWVSTQECALFGDDPVPCFVLNTLVNSDVPIFTQMAHQRQPGTFQEDWLLAERWLQFSEEYPTISPPPKWTTSCYNTDNGFDINPLHGYVATPTGRDNFTIALMAPPISTLGDVEVTIIPSDGCTGCHAFEELDGTPLSMLTFTLSNWNVPQKVYIRYVEEGEAYFYFSAVGGGYEIRNWQTGVEEDQTKSSQLRVLTCEGIPGYGCNKRK